MENFYEVYNTASEVGAYANYDGAARKYNVVALGNGENPQGAVVIAETNATPRFCHCGVPLDNTACECEDCTAEWQEFMSDQYALAHPGALM